MRPPNPASRLGLASATLIALVSWGGCAGDEALEPITTGPDRVNADLAPPETHGSGCEPNVFLEPCLDGELNEPQIAQCADCVLTANTTGTSARVVRHYEPNPTVCKPEAQAVFNFDTEGVASGRKLGCARFTVYISRVETVDGQCIGLHKIALYARKLPACPPTLTTGDWVGCGTPATLLGEFAVPSSVPAFKTFTLPVSAINLEGITQLVFVDRSFYTLPLDPCFPGAAVFFATSESSNENVRPELAIQLGPFTPCIDGDLFHSGIRGTETPCNDCIFTANSTSGRARVGRDGDETVNCAERQAVFAFDTSTLSETETVIEAEFSFTVKSIVTLGYTGHHVMHVYARPLGACPPLLSGADWVRQVCGPVPAIHVGLALINDPGRYTASLAFPGQTVNTAGITELVLVNASPFLEDPEAAIIADVFTSEGPEEHEPELEVTVVPVVRGSSGF